MKKALLITLLFLNISYVYAKGIASPRPGTCSTSQAMEAIDTTKAELLTCMDDFITVFPKDYGVWTSCDYPKCPSNPVFNHIGSVELIAAYAIVHGRKTLLSFHAVTINGGQYYDIDIRNVQGNQYGRFLIQLVWKVNNVHYASTPIYDTFPFQKKCEVSLFDKQYPNLIVNEVVEKYRVFSADGEIKVHPTSEHTINIADWEKGNYEIEVLAPEALAGKYIITLDDEEKEDNNFVFPNPATDYIQFQEPVEQCLLKDEKGEVRGEYQNVQKIDLVAFKEGIYYVQIITDDKLTKTYRISVKR